jgi:hypothetical protein
MEGILLCLRQKVEVWDLFKVTPGLYTKFRCPSHAQQLAISTVGANVTSRKELLKGSLAAFVNCMTTWFYARNSYLMRQDNAGCPLISAGFKISDKQPPLLAALAWLVASALNSTFEFGGNPTKNGEVRLEK